MRYLLIVPLLVFIGLGVHNIQEQKDIKSNFNIKLNSEQLRRKNLSDELLRVNQELDTTKGKSKADKEKIKELQKQRDDLNNKLQAKIKAKQQLQVASRKALFTGTAEAEPTGTTNCGDNPYKQFIYQHESGCRTNAVNQLGCYGIGQSCPRSKIAHCGTDFACQDAWFSNYAVQRYGSWEGAYNFWKANNWW